MRARPVDNVLFAGQVEKPVQIEGGFHDDQRVEVGAGHYPLLVSLHIAWLGALVVMVPADAPLRMPPLILYIAVQGLRYWAMAALGENWTTRIITVPGRTPVRHGPYRYLRHPNYLVVACEIAVLPLIFGAWRIALLFTMLNGAMLAHRIRIENAALAAETGSGHAIVCRK